MVTYTYWTGKGETPNTSNPDNWSDGLPSHDKMGIFGTDIVSEIRVIHDIRGTDYLIDFWCEQGLVIPYVDGIVLVGGEIWLPANLVQHFESFKDTQLEADLKAGKIGLPPPEYAIFNQPYDRYWVGGDGNWSDNTLHWSASSSGLPGASKPAAGDSVYIDNGSDVLGVAFQITLDENTAALNALSLNCTDATATVAILTYTLEHDGTLSQANGAITISTGIINSDGAVALSGGTFGSNASYTWNINNGFTNTGGTANCGTGTDTLAASKTFANTTGTCNINGGNLWGASASTSVVTNSGGTWNWATVNIKLLDFQFSITTGANTLTISGNITIDAFTVSNSGGLSCTVAGTQITGNASLDVGFYNATVTLTGSAGNNVVLGSGTRVRRLMTLANAGTLSLSYVTINGSIANNGALDLGTTTTTLTHTIDNVTLNNNNANGIGYESPGGTLLVTITNSSFTGGNGAAWNAKDISLYTSATLQLNTCTFTQVGMQATSGWLVSKDASSNFTVYGILASSETPSAGYRAANVTGTFQLSNANAYSSAFNSSYTLGANMASVTTFTINASTTFSTSGTNYALTVTGATSITGTLTTNTSTIATTGLVTVNTNGTFGGATAYTWTINGGVTNSGGTINFGTGTDTLAASKTIANTTGTANINGGYFYGASATTSIVTSGGTWNWATVTTKLLDYQFDITTGGGAVTITVTDNITIDNFIVSALDTLVHATSGKTITVNNTKNIEIYGTVTSTGGASNVTWTGYYAFIIWTTTIQTATLTTFTGTLAGSDWKSGMDLSIGIGAKQCLDRCTISGGTGTGANYIGFEDSPTTGWIVTKDASSNFDIYGIVGSEAPSAGYKTANITGDFMLSLPMYGDTAYTLQANMPNVQAFTLDGFSVFYAVSYTITPHNTWVGMNFDMGTSTIVIPNDLSFTHTANGLLPTIYNLTINDNVTVTLGTTDTCIGNVLTIGTGTAHITGLIGNENLLINSTATHPLVLGNTTAFTGLYTVDYLFDTNRANLGDGLTFNPSSGLGIYNYSAGNAKTITMNGNITCTTCIIICTNLTVPTAGNTIVDTDGYSITDTGTGYDGYSLIVGDHGGTCWQGSLICNNSTITVKDVRIGKAGEIGLDNSWIEFETSSWLVSGDWNCNSTSASWDDGTATMNFNGTLEQALYLNDQASANIMYYNITISNASGTQVVIGANTIDINGDLNCTSSADTFFEIVTNNPTIKTSGDVSFADMFQVYTIGRTATWYFDGSTNYSDNNTMNPIQNLGNVVIDGTLTMITLGIRVADITINNLFIASVIGNPYVYVSGDWTRAGIGVFTYNNSTVEFEGTSTITGMQGATNRFYDVQVAAGASATTADRVMIQGTLSGTRSFSGASSNFLYVHDLTIIPTGTFTSAPDPAGGGNSRKVLEVIGAI